MPRRITVLSAVCCLAGLIGATQAHAANELSFDAQWGNPVVFEFPRDAAYDASGNLYVLDTSNNRVVKFNSSGVQVATWGGQGNADGQLNYPNGIDVDSAGNVYVAEYSNFRVEKFSSTGTFLTKWGSFGGSNGQFAFPYGLALGPSDNVYVSEKDAQNRLQQFTSAGVHVTTFSGTGAFSNPHGIDVDASGNVYIADYDGGRMQKLTPPSTYTPFGATELAGPEGVAVSPTTGKIYVADGQQIFRFSSGLAHEQTWGDQAGLPTDSNFRAPGSPAINADGSLVAVPDSGNHRIQIFDADGGLKGKIGDGGDGDGELFWPYGGAADAAGNVYVADTENNRIEKFDQDGTYLTQWTASDTNPFRPIDAAVDPEGDVWALDINNYKARQFEPDGTPISTLGGFGFDDAHLFLRAWSGIAADPNGDILVADGNNYKVKRFSQAGTPLGSFGSHGAGAGQFSEMAGIALAPNRDILVADSDLDRVQRFGPDGILKDSFGSHGTGDGQFDRAVGVEVDAAGRIYVVDQVGFRVQQFAPDGTFLGSFGGEGTDPGRFDFPTQPFTSPSGALYVADTQTDRIQKLVDLVSPVVSIDSAPSSPTPNTVLSFAFSASEPVIWECRVDGAAFAPCSGDGTHQTGQLAGGSHTFEVRGADASGNSDSESRLVTVDVPAPPPAGPTGQRAAALKKCKKKKSAAARRKCKKRARTLPL